MIGFSQLGWVLSRNQLTVCELPQTAAIWHITCQFQRGVGNGPLRL
jgi:hypothetical protein